jgi:hypothetical protein
MNHSKITDLLKDLVIEGRTVLGNIPEGTKSDPMFIRVNLFSRYIHRIDTIIPMIDQWDENSSDTVGIIIRACLVDVISQFYLEHIHSKVKSIPSEEETEYLLVAHDLLADHIFSVVGYFKAMKDENAIDSIEYKESIDDIRKLYNKFFKDEAINYENPKKSMKANSFPKPRAILKTLRKSDLLNRHEIDSLYLSYFHYSKYEHFGITTIPLKSQNLNTHIEILTSSLSYILLACLICTTHFEYADQASKISTPNRFKKSVEKIYSIREELVQYYVEFQQIVNGS